MVLWRKDNMHDVSHQPHQRFLVECQSYIEANKCSTADVEIEHEIADSGEFIKVSFTFADRKVYVEFVVVGVERRTRGKRMEMEMLRILLLFSLRLTF
jgi:hypothetical protein